MKKPVSVAKKLTANTMPSSAPTSTSVQEPSAKTIKPRSNKPLIFVMAGLLIIALGFGGFMYWKYRDISNDTSSSISEKNQEETTRVLDRLKKRLLVNETDAPTVARVDEPEKLKNSNQEFYKDVQKGDYLVIFPKRAIIYRETIDQIINVAPIINTADLKADEGATPSNTAETKNN
jgi:uncharacterized protein HemX